MMARSRWRALLHGLPLPELLWAGLLLAVLHGGLIGCALVPGIPAGPIGGPGLRAGVTYGYAHSPTSAQTRQPSGDIEPLRGNGSMFGGSAPFFPLRAMVRASPDRFIDIGADLGWTDAALQLRAGPLDARRKLPWGFELEWRTGELSAYDHDSARRVRVYGARAEAYPALGSLGKFDTYGVLTLGVSTGTRMHVMFVPFRDDNADPHRSAALEVARTETRLELSLGMHGRSKPMALTVALLPWFVLDQGRVRGASCFGCSLEFESLSATWGLGLVASGSLYWEKE